jgi:hypothetical protein
VTPALANTASFVEAHMDKTKERKVIRQISD